ncbi:hypothetical protein G9P44_005444 [Scheffersomyces stipitis]|nr:hypothetical protein G9P44_005444 [Scheffersomyces stipitis]
MPQSCWDFLSFSLAYLLETFAHFKTSKKYQLADWRIRPLSPPMMAYARSDTHFLLSIFDQLKNKLYRCWKREASKELLENTLKLASDNDWDLVDKWNDTQNGRGVAGVDYSNIDEDQTLEIDPEKSVVVKHDFGSEYNSRLVEVWNGLQELEITESQPAVEIQPIQPVISFKEDKLDPNEIVTIRKKKHGGSTKKESSNYIETVRRPIQKGVFKRVEQINIQLNGLSLMEINELRPFVLTVMNKLRKLHDTKSGRNAEAEEMDEARNYLNKYQNQFDFGDLKISSSAKYEQDVSKLTKRDSQRELFVNRYLNKQNPFINIYDDETKLKNPFESSIVQTFKRLVNLGISPIVFLDYDHLPTDSFKYNELYMINQVNKVMNYLGKPKKKET